MLIGGVRKSIKAHFTVVIYLSALQVIVMESAASATLNTPFDCERSDHQIGHTNRLWFCSQPSSERRVVAQVDVISD